MSSDERMGAVQKPENVPTTSMYELFIGILTIISIIGMLILFVLRVFYPDSPNISILFAMDTLYCMFFLVDFARNLIHAKSKREYLFWRGTLDFLGSIPAFPALRLARVGRLMRAFELIRTVGARGLARQFIERRSEGALYLTVLVTMLMLSIGSNVVLAFENGNPDANIHTGRNAYWWAFVTVTTVGYGDYFPVTNGGRVVGMGLMALGIGIFGVLTSFMSSLFLAPRKEKQPEPAVPAPVPIDSKQLQDELTALRRELAEIKQLLQGRQSA